MFNKDEPKNAPGTGHIVTLDGETTKSQVWLQTDRHQLNPSTATDTVLTAMSWVSFSAMLVHLIKLVAPISFELALFLTGCLGCFGVYSLITQTPKTFYSYIALFFLALILVTL